MTVARRAESVLMPVFCYQSEEYRLAWLLLQKPILLAVLKYCLTFGGPGHSVGVSLLMWHLSKAALMKKVCILLVRKRDG